MEIPDKEEVIARFMKDYGVSNDIAQVIFEDILLACGLTHYNSYQNITIQLSALLQAYVKGTLHIQEELQEYVNKLDKSRSKVSDTDVFSNFINNMYKDNQ